MTEQPKRKVPIFYGKVMTAESEQTIEVGEINGTYEINIEIPLTWEMENFIFGKDELQ